MFEYQIVMLDRTRVRIPLPPLNKDIFYLRWKIGGNNQFVVVLVGPRKIEVLETWKLN